jgi:hypothetical protein
MVFDKVKENSQMSNMKKYDAVLTLLIDSKDEAVNKQLNENKEFTTKHFEVEAEDMKNAAKVAIETAYHTNSKDGILPQGEITPFGSYVSIVKEIHLVEK